MTQRREDMRAADSDRQYVADRLREALDEGRLDLGEYDERLQRTYAARTYGELDKLLHDLPSVVSPTKAQVARPTPAPPPAAPVRRPVAPWVAALWGSWFTTTVICFVIWALTGAGYPWPLWVAVPWGAVLLVRTVTVVASGDPNGQTAAQRERDRRRQQERWQRRQDRWERRQGR